MATQQPRRVWAGASQCERRLRVEHLEGRRLLAVVTVDTELDVVDPTDGLTSLREAIVTTNTDLGPDGIVFDFGHDGPTVILLEYGELEITEALTIMGDGPELLTIDARQQSRIFNITADTGDFAISGMTLTNGRTSGENQNFDDSTFNGGAIRSLSSEILTIENSTVSNSSTTGVTTLGGGLWTSGSITVASSTILGNSTTASGGGVLSLGNVTVTSSTISGNSVGSRGGGIYSNGDVTVTSTTISGNSAGFRGGGMYSYGEIAVTSSTISGNSAIYTGGGINVLGNLTITSSTVSGNSANGQPYSNGGGVRGSAGVNVESSTIAGNSAKQSGGIQASKLTVVNSIVAGNSDGGTAPDLSSNTLSVQYSLIGDNSGTGLPESPVGFPDGNGNLIGGPIGGIVDPFLGPLAGNGGPVFTHAVSAGSAAIDAGNPDAMAGINGVALFDQRGTPYTRVSGGRIDMGAYERQPLTVDIFEVASPIAIPIEEIVIQFSSATTGFDLGDLKLSLNGGENLLTDSQTLSTSDNQTFVLGDIADVTTGSGYYTLDLISPGSSIVGASGGPLDTGDSVGWAMGRSVLGLTVNTLVDEWDGSIDDGDISLRDAIAAAAPGETIDFDSSLSGGTILLTNGELPVTRALTLDATSMAAGLFIDASGADPRPDLDDGRGSRIFNIDDRNDFVDSPVTIRGLTLAGGDVSGAGGAIHARETLIVNSSTITGNSATYSGGGIWGRMVTITSSMISGNSVIGDYRGHSGGIYANGDVTVTSSTISGNSADSSEGRGGGIYATGDVTITFSTISGNSADGYRGSSGGIRATGNVTVVSSMILGNTTSGYGGGGIYASGDVTVTSSTISGNSDSGFGRGGGVLAYGDVTVNSSTISGNSAPNGGAIHASGDVTVSSSTISGNSADGEFGGGIFTYGDVTVNSSTLSGNSASFAAGIFATNYRDLTVVSSTISGNSGGGIFLASFAKPGSSGAITNSIVAGNWRTSNTGRPIADDLSGIFTLGYSIVGMAMDGINTLPGTINYIGVDPLIGPLADNGGPTQTHALLPGSPALDAGDPSVPLDPNLYDQRGAPFHRVATGVIAGIPTNLVDIGAYEAQSPPSADFLNDDIINGVDFLAWQRGFGTADAGRTDGNSDDDRDVDQSDLAAWRATYGQTEGPPPPISTVRSRQSAVGSAALIDAALALNWKGRVLDDEEALVLDDSDSPAVVVDSVWGQRYDGRLPVDDERVASVASATETDNHEQTWLAEELLMRAFG